MSQIWEIREDEELIQRVQESFNRLLRSPPPGYTIELTVEEIDFSPEKNMVLYFIGHDLDNPIGYAHCMVSGPAKDIGTISNLDALDVIYAGEPILAHVNGTPVTGENLKDFPGYNQYTGIGEVLYIGLMETFLRRQGYGTELLEFIKKDFELIDVESIGEKSTEFFIANDFIDTGIRYYANCPVLVWNNPEFS